jgi:uncharacterized protein
MKWLAQWISNRNAAWSVVLLVAGLSAAAGLQVTNVEHDDNLLAFMPQDNPDVEAFNQVNELFGSLDLALVGVEAPDVFQPDFITRLKRATKDLKETRGINHVLTLANVVDFTPDTEHGGVVTTPMIEEVPKTPEEVQALRQRVMGKEHLVGHLVSEDGKAVLLYCFLAYGTDPKNMAASIQEVVKEAFPENKAYWGGGPFVSTYIYEATQQDIRRLTPWAVLAIILIMTLAFRDVIGVGLVLLSTALGILMSLGVMAFFNVRFNIVLGSMPVILFAVGSAYGIHVLARYYALVKEHDYKTALEQTLIGIGPVVLAAGLTTAAGLLSFVCMDIQPLRIFGLFTSLGILATLILSITFVPAVVCLSRLNRKASAGNFLKKTTVRLAGFAQTHRLPVGIVLVVICLFSGTMVSQVRTSMDTGSFFSKGSPPDLAEQFLRRHFGGSSFIQVHIKGDMNDPEVLREIHRLADQVSLLDNVANVLHLGDAIAQGNQAFVGQQRIPDTAAQVGMLHRLLGSDPSVEQLVTRDRTQALLHIKVGSNVAEDQEVLLAQIEQVFKEQLVTRYVDVEAGDKPEAASARRQDLALWRIRALSNMFDVSLDQGRQAKLLEALKQPSPRADPAMVNRKLVRFLRSDECAVDLSEWDSALVSRIAASLVALGPGFSEERVAETLKTTLANETLEGEEELVEDLAMSVTVPLEVFWKEQAASRRADEVIAAAGLKVPPGEEGEHFRKAMMMAMLDLQSPTVMLPAGDRQDAKTLVARVTGLPVMHRGLSRSATSNQIKSLIFALVLVVLIMAVFFRSLFSGLLVASPTILTLLIIYGGMGLLEVRLDIGTAMLASLILGAGVDYAVHLASAWRAEKGETLHAAAVRAAKHSGPAIWTNAITVCAGFFVLTLGEAKPLKNVGGLTAAAMIVAALATFLAIPVLARKRRYRRQKNVPEKNNTTNTVETALKMSR